MESKVETNNDTVEIKNEVDNDTTQPEVVKKSGAALGNIHRLSLNRKQPKVMNLRNQKSGEDQLDGVAPK